MARSETRSALADKAAPDVRQGTSRVLKFNGSATEYECAQTFSNTWLVTHQTRPPDPSIYAALAKSGSRTRRQIQGSCLFKDVTHLGSSMKSIELTRLYIEPAVI